MLDLPQKHLKGISDIDHATWRETLVDNRNMHKATRFHFRQHIVQRVAWVAIRGISRHYSCNCDRAASSMTTSDLSNDIRLGDDTGHPSVTIAHDHKAYVGVGQKFCCIGEEGISLNRTQTLQGYR